MKKQFLLLSLLSLLVQTASAQLINIEKKRNLDQQGLAGQIELGGRFTNNVNQITTFNNRIALQYAHKAHRLMLFNELDLIRVNSSDLANNGFQHLRYNYTLADSSAFTLEAFVQHQNDRLKKLDSRFITGGGMRFRVVRTPKFYLYFAPLLMYERERFTDDANPNFDLLKWDAYLVASLRIADKIRFNTITYYQPQFTNFGRYRISHESSLEMPIIRRLSLVLSYTLTYDSYPATDVPKLFSDYRNTLKYSF